jgi:hypothetical protein
LPSSSVVATVGTAKVDDANQQEQDPLTSP